MAEPEHIGKPIKRVLEVLEVVYRGDDFDEAIDRRLRELGIRPGQVGVILAIPPGMAGRDDKQIKLFD